MTMPGGAMCGGVREEVGPVTYLLPLPTHTRLTELEEEEEEESGRASQIGSESEWPPMPNRRSFVRPSFHVHVPMCREPATTTGATMPSNKATTTKRPRHATIAALALTRDLAFLPKEMMDGRRWEL